VDCSTQYAFVSTLNDYSQSSTEKWMVIFFNVFHTVQRDVLHFIKPTTCTHTYIILDHSYMFPCILYLYILTWLQHYTYFVLILWYHRVAVCDQVTSYARRLKPDRGL
jgi:hypothetical protein